MERSARGQWSSQLGFILAAAGSAVGLGNIWKFPFITHHNGGGAFVLIYLLCIALVGLPLMLAEIYMGKQSQRDPVGAFRRLKSGSKLWPWVGALSVLSSFVILSYYSVVSGWVLHYIYISFTGALSGLSAGEVSDYFQNFAANGVQQVGYHGGMMAIIMIIVYAGVKGGIERANRFFMPTLLVILVLLTVFAMWNRAGWEATVFLFDPSNFHNLRAGGILEALGHSFFTLSLAMGAMITYGSYLSEDEEVMPSGVWIVLADVVIALLACFLIYSILFSFDEEVGAGPGLLFVTLPNLIEQMTGNTLSAALFFALVLFAAITSAISLFEAVVATAVDELGLRRHLAVPLCGAIIFLVGIPSALSMGALGDITILGRNIFDFLDYLASNWMLPIGGLLTAFFVGHVIEQEPIKRELTRSWPRLYVGWHFVVRYVTPALVVLVIAKTTGLIDWLLG